MYARISLITEPTLYEYLHVELISPAITLRLYPGKDGLITVIDSDKSPLSMQSNSSIEVVKGLDAPLIVQELIDKLFPYETYIVPMQEQVIYTAFYEKAKDNLKKAEDNEFIA